MEKKWIIYIHIQILINKRGINMSMIEADVLTGIDKVIETQEYYINKITEDIIRKAKENLYILVNSGKINDEIDLNDITWSYSIAKAVMIIATKDVNEKWHTNCHFNTMCKRYEEIIKGEMI